ncbi:Pentatricopeptide repeat superfamily protein [Hibiscus syriacus]|uniref:Pentatricopeptide repeat superfamily protein n=1 Tax=Hibiscus syriacus TaxID=106335 RepID=A0A6A3BLD3_HIBSY|nr:uncharacterized protein LOC120214379 [Hibiscus syriacus]KAE8717125.1 Pentatricopeptide repeat superfamily protein [Hibiscus syriacus]
MASGLSTRFSYQRLKHEEGAHDEHEADWFPGRSRPWPRLRSVSVKIKRFRVKVPSLRRYLRRKLRVARVSFGKLVKRLKESQAHFGDLFAGNYMFIQVNPSTMKGCLGKPCEGFALTTLPPSRYSLSGVA